MTWQTEITPIVRNIIGDMSASPTYSDTRIQGVILVSTQLMNREASFLNSYVVDFANSGLTPDPTSPRDEVFISLVSLKSACVIANSELRTYSLTGMRVIDGVSQIDTTGMGNNMKNVATNACKAYQDAVKQYMLGNAEGARIISGPFTQTFLGTYNLLQE